MDKHLHIVTHEIPWPVDFGGVYDLFNKIKALHEHGIKIHLHCFTKSRKPQQILEKYCSEVHYYPRRLTLGGIIQGLPIMVADRSSMLLTKRLLSDSYPVLLEGIQCTSCLNSLNKKKKVVVRLHNIESEYYHVLYQGEKNPIKKIYFLLESILLKKYEQEIFTQQTCLTVSDKDAEWIQNRFPASKVKHLPVFISDNELTTPLDLGSFCLYHANLSVNENEAAAIWLLKEVFHHTSIPLVIAGKNPSNKLIKLAHEKTNTCIVANPDKHEMEDLIRKAQINILPSLNQTGVKIKIIESLQIGRHCITNGNGSGDRKLDEMLIVTTSSNEMLEKIESLYNTPFRKEDKTFRDEKMRRIFDSERQTKELISLLY